MRFCESTMLGKVCCQTIHTPVFLPRPGIAGQRPSNQQRIGGIKRKVFHQELRTSTIRSVVCESNTKDLVDGLLQKLDPAKGTLPLISLLNPHHDMTSQWQSSNKVLTHLTRTSFKPNWSGNDWVLFCSTSFISQILICWAFSAAYLLTFPSVVRFRQRCQWTADPGRE